MAKAIVLIKDIKARFVRVPLLRCVRGHRIGVFFTSL